MKIFGVFIILAAMVSEILNFSVEDCTKGTTAGSIRCLAYGHVYHWDHSLQVCERAFYGGCGATPNNFRNLKECQKVAEPVCKNKN